MKWMIWAVSAALVALMVAPGVSGLDDSETDFGQAYFVRMAFGTLPDINVTVPADTWNIAEYIRFEHDGDHTEIPMSLPIGARFIHVDCTCGGVDRDGDTFIVTDTAPAGNHVLRLVTSTQTGRAAALGLALAGTADRSDARVIIYAPEGDVAQGSLPLDANYPLASTAAHPGLEIYQFTGSLPAEPWFTITPEPVGTTAPVQEDGGFSYFAVITGMVAGAAVWAFLVQRGVVQKRSRKQVAAQAGHITAGKEGKETLQARKRVLMAALKELELAKMNGEVDPAAYDALKAEYKRQTVTVMRALEEAT